MSPPSLKVLKFTGTVDFRSAMVRTGKRNQMGNQSAQLAGCINSIAEKRGSFDRISAGTTHSARQSPDASLVAVRRTVLELKRTSKSPLGIGSARSRRK